MTTSNLRLLKGSNKARSLGIIIPRGCSEIEMGRISYLNQFCNKILPNLEKINENSRNKSREKIKVHKNAKIEKKMGKEIFKQISNKFKGKIDWGSFFDSTTDKVTISVDPFTARIPWELAYDGNEFLCDRFQTTRRLLLDKTTWIGGQTPKEQGIDKALVIGINYEDDLLFPEHEAYDIASRLKGLGYDIVTGGPITGKDATLRKITSLLKKLKEPLAVLHFSGHGSANYLSMYDKKLTTSRLKDCLNPMGAPFLTFLNACSTNQFDRTGLVKALAELGGEHVIATFWTIIDEPSALFADSFYDQVKKIKQISIPEAVYKSRKKLRKIEEVGKDRLAFVIYGGEFPLLNTG